MKVLDHGEVRLVDFMGGDNRVDQAAGISLDQYDRERDEAQVRRLIRYMLKHRHGTPFEHSVFTFFVRAPLFVVREWMRHRIGSYNEVSGRYAKLPFVVYKPEARSPIVEVPANKQGSVPAPELQGIVDTQARRAYLTAYDSYSSMLEAGVAKEVARMVLPLNLYTGFVWTVNARSLMNFISLRGSEDAQKEIRDYALALEELFAEKMPITYEEFITNGAVAP